MVKHEKTWGKNVLAKIPLFAPQEARDKPQIVLRY